jgi:hypothetical protein
VTPCTERTELQSLNTLLLQFSLLGMLRCNASNPKLYFLWRQTCYVGSTPHRYLKYITVSLDPRIIASYLGWGIFLKAMNEAKSESNARLRHWHISGPFFDAVAISVETLITAVDHVMRAADVATAWPPLGRLHQFWSADFEGVSSIWGQAEVRWCQIRMGKDLPAPGAEGVHCGPPLSCISNA